MERKPALFAWIAAAFALVASGLARFRPELVEGSAPGERYVDFEFSQVKQEPGRFPERRRGRKLVASAAPDVLR